MRWSNTPKTLVYTRFVLLTSVAVFLTMFTAGTACAREVSNLREFLNSGLTAEPTQSVVRDASEIKLVQYNRPQRYTRSDNAYRRRPDYRRYNYYGYPRGYGYYYPRYYYPRRYGYQYEYGYGMPYYRPYLNYYYYYDGPGVTFEIGPRGYIYYYRW